MTSTMKAFNNFWRRGVIIMIFHTVCISAFSFKISSLQVVELKCNGLVKPFGIDSPNPSLSWIIQSAPDDHDQVQTAYQVQVASSEENLAKNIADLWDSKRVRSSDNINVRYCGTKLSSEQTCYWRVRIWDKHQKVSSWSYIHSFTMGLMEQADWKGYWIEDSKPLPNTDSGMYKEHPAPYFRKQFNIVKPIRHAYLHVAGLGFNQLYMNGSKEGDKLLDPAWTDYSKRIYYSSYDVSNSIRKGDNVIGTWLGNGWYNPLPMFMWARLNLREHLTIGKPRFILQLNITYLDGSHDSVQSDTSWLANDSHILKNNIYLGEKHDMRRLLTSWCKPGLNLHTWRPSIKAMMDSPNLVSEIIPPIRITEIITPKRITKLSNERYVVDFGKNFAGAIQLTAGGKAGETIRIKYGELLYPDGSVNVMTSVAGQIKNKNVSGNGARDTAYRLDELILSGGKGDTLLPQFSYTGFRYIEIFNYPGLLQKSDVAGLRINTDVERAGFFSCSDSLLNTIYQNSINTFLSNLHGLQTDCPHRERFGYGGDIAITAPSLIWNFDMKKFYEKTLIDFSDAQHNSGAFTETAPYVGISDEALTPKAGPIGWGYAFPVLLDELFRYYGDTAILEKHYASLKNWVDYLKENSKELVIDKGISDHESLDPKPVALTGTAFFFQSASLLAKFATILNKTPDARIYQLLADNIREVFLKKFLDTKSGKFDIGTQAAQSFALKFGLVPENLVNKSVEVLLDAVRAKNFHVATGMFGTLYMLEMLSEYGHHETAWKIVQQKDFPGWGHMISLGATTIWEHWEFSDNTFSHNHPMWGSICEWIIKYVAGISPLEKTVGFNKVKILPYGLAHLDTLEAGYNSVMGMVKISWKKTKKGKEIKLSIPVNTMAEVHLPGRQPFNIGSGIYRVEIIDKRTSTSN